MRRIASCIIMALLFLGLSVFTFTVQPAKAQAVSEEIIINPDGSISSPVPANITNSKNVTYTFTGNNYLPIIVNRSNIIINGMGYTLQASGENGFSLTLMSNVTIKDTTITNSNYGIYLNSSSGNILSGNNLTANSYGIWLYSSSSNSISGNNIANNTEIGVFFYSSSHCTVSGNTFQNDGLAVLASFHNLVKNNLVNGKPLCYLEGVWVPTTVPSDVGQVVLENCSSIVVNSLSLSNASIGVELWQTNSTRITNNNITKNNIADIVIFSSSNNNSISGNNIGNNSEFGIMLNSSSSNSISGNNITNNTEVGIYLDSSNSSSISGNNIANNMYGVALLSSSGCTVSGNNITANTYCGVYLSSSNNNRFFHNNFINNTQQVSSDGSPNTWDNGYPSGGNYWSDYQTTYPNASEIDSSAIWNASYVIDANNTDRYPLMAPFHTFSVGTWSGVAYSVDTVSNSTITNLSFNQPAKTLSFNVTGPSGTTGFCRVAIPLSLMSGTWIVIVNGTSISYSTTTDSNYTYIYFTYHHSTETVQITSATVIPEFQPSMLLPLFMVITLIGAIILKRKRKVRN